MKTPRHHTSLILVSLLSVASLASGQTSSAPDFIWKGGDGNWDDNSMWTNPSGSGFNRYYNCVYGNIEIDGGKTTVASTVTLRGFPYNAQQKQYAGEWGANHLTIDPGDTLVTTSPLAANAIINNGAFIFHPAPAGHDSAIFVSANSTSFIGGTGVYTFAAGDLEITVPEVNGVPNGPGSVTVGVGTTLQGRGDMGAGNVTILNNGTFSANDTSGPMVLRPGLQDKTFKNSSTGIAQATNGGILQLDGESGGTFSGGTFQVVDSGNIEFTNGAIVSNTTLSTKGTGKISIGTTVTLGADITLDGSLEVVDSGVLNFSGPFITANGTLYNDHDTYFTNGLSNDGFVELGSNQQDTLTGNVTNNGTIQIDDNNNFVINNPATFSGTGAVTLNGTTATLSVATEKDRITIGAGQTVNGFGLLGYTASITNQGTVNANVAGQVLDIAPATADFTNTGAGFAEAANGGILSLVGSNNGTNTFTGGSFRALAGSQITLTGNPLLTKTTLSTSGTGAVVVSGYASFGDAVTLNGALNVTDDSELATSGTLTNNGTINLDSTGHGGFFTLTGATTLAGTGAIHLNGTNDQITGSGGLLTIGAGQTITGSGNIGANEIAITNNGVINANVNGATLTLEPDAGTDFTNKGAGFAEAANGGTLSLYGTANSVFTGGSFRALDGSQITLDDHAVLTSTTLSTSGTGVAVANSATVNGATFAGTVNIPNNDQLYLAGDLTNKGTLNVGGPPRSSGGSYSSGEINAVSSAVLTNAVGGVIQGNGSIYYCGVINNGTIAAHNNGLSTSSSDDSLGLIGQAVTNNGTMIASDRSQLYQDATSTLTNYDPDTKTLTGGTYEASGPTRATLSLACVPTGLKAIEIGVNAATVIIDGPNSTVDGMQFLTDNQGKFSLLRQRQFTITGALSLSNEGTITLDAGSTLHVPGSFTATATSTLSFVIGGTATSGTKSPGVLQANGKATLAGNLVVTFASSAALPKYTDTFTIFSAASTPTGNFANVANGARLDTSDGKGSFQVGYGASSANAPTQIVLSHFSTQLASVITSPKTAAGTQDQSFSYQITASNSPTKFGVKSLPGGLSIDAATGLISGTPTAAGKFTLTLFAYNAAGHGSATLSLTIAAAKPVITSATTATATVGKAFTYQITATNNPTSYGVGGLFQNITVNKQTGLVSGTPMAAGTHTLTLQAANAAGTGTKTLTLTVTN